MNAGANAATAAEQTEATQHRLAQPYHLRNIIIYLAASLSICLLGTWRMDFVSMEGILALGAQHMLRTHEWFVPKLYGAIYAYKPAMGYWLAAVPQALVDSPSEFALRVPFALCGIVWGLAIYFLIARLVSPRCGLYAALALVFSGSFIQEARIVGFDVALSMGIGVAMLCAFRCLALRQPNWRWWMLGYIGLTFGFLVKGMPAPTMYFPGLVAACLATRQVRQLFRWQHLMGVAMFAGLVGAYLLLAYHEQGWAAFHDQAAEISDRSVRWNMGVFLATLAKPLMIFGIALPWSVLLLWLAIPGRVPLPGDTARQLVRIAGIFLIVGILIWMVVATVTTRYYMPLLTPIAVLAGVAAEALMVRRRGVVVTVGLLGIASAGIYIGVFEPTRNAERSERRAAVLFDPYLPPEAKVYVDASDRCSSLFFYLKHEVGRYRTNSKTPPKSPIYVVLTKAQHQYMVRRTDCHMEILATLAGMEDRAYALVRLSRAW